MSKVTIAEMRKIQEFIPWNKWPNAFHTNCIAYALGLAIDDPQRQIFVPLLKDSAAEKLESLLKDLNLEYRRINSEKELDGSEYGIVLYDYLYKQSKRAFGFEWTEETQEIHLARIEPDGYWTHKSGWYNEPSITTPAEIHDLILTEDNVDVKPTAYFAVRKPQ